MSIRMKLTAWFGIALVVIVTAVYFLFRLAASSVLMRTQREYLVAGVEANAGLVHYYASEEEIADTEGRMFFAYADGYLAIDDGFLDVINDVYGALYTNDGTLIYGINPLARETVGEAFSASKIARITVEDTEYEVYDRQLALEGTDELWLRGVVSMSEGKEQLAAITRIALFLLPAFVAVALWCGYLIAGRLIRPVTKIEQAAASIAGGTDLKRRIAMQGADDELHRLADTFDGMMDRLEASFEAEKQFATDSSHALRTPTAVILAECEHTLEKERSVAEYEEALRTIRRQGAKMNGIIIDTLAHLRREEET